MGKSLALATVATGVLFLSACNKPAADNGAMMADNSSNMMAVPADETMNADNAMMGNAMDANAMAPNAMEANSDDNATDPHSSSSGK